MKHTFIWNGSSWWLKISTIEEMCDYLNVEWDRRKQACLEDKERVKKKFHSSNYLTGACDIISTVRYISFNEALDGLQKQLYKNWYQFLLEGKTIFVNGVGGYNLTMLIINDKKNNKIVFAKGDTSAIITAESQAKSEELKKFEELQETPNAKNSSRGGRIFR